MTDRAGLVVAVVALSLVCAVTVALVVAIRRDGRGHRPPPVSRHSWDAGTTVERLR
jgi:hypothetical protein